MTRNTHWFKTGLTNVEKQPRLAWAVAIGWVSLVSLIAFWWHLGGIGLVDETEPLFAEAARQMTVTGDWITPYFDGVTRFDKPPLVYWIMAIAYKTIGVNEWAARFPSAIAGTVLVGFGFYVLKRFGFSSPAQTLERDSESLESLRTARQSLQRWSAALIGSALIGLNPQTIVWGRTGVSDMLLSGCVGSALLAFFMGYAQPEHPRNQARWYLAFWIFSGLAVLTKGPVGIVLPGLIILVFLGYLGNLTVLREMQIVKGGLLFLAIAIPWFVLVIQANGEAYINAFFGYHNFDRFTQVVNHHSAPWFFYFLVVPISFAPWSVHLPIAIARLRFWQRRSWQQSPRSAQLGLFALIWLVVIFGFFTIAVTKLPSYTIPLLPAASILTALFWSNQLWSDRLWGDRLTSSRRSTAVQASHWANVVLLIGLATATLVCTRWMGKDPEMPDFRELLEQSGILTRAALIWAIAAIVAIGLLLRRQGRWLWCVNLIGFSAFIVVALMPATLLMDSQRQLPLRQMAAAIVQVQQPNEPMMMIGFEKPSLVFYAQRPIVYQADLEQVPRRLQKLASQSPTPPSILVLGRIRKLKEAGLLKPDAYRYRSLAQDEIYQLIRISLPLR